MKQLHQVVSWLIILLGIIHLAFASCYGAINEDMLWFSGSGLAIVFAGFINLIRSASDLRIVYIIAAITNAITFILFAAVAFIMPQPQVYAGVILFLIAMWCSMSGQTIIKK
jgi:hypothetical protein